jgi:preprotein translocase subunit SecE
MRGHWKVTTTHDERHAVSDEREGAGSAGDDTGTGEPSGVDETRGQTAVVTRPARPTGKRVRRELDGESDGEQAPETDGKASKNGGGKAKKTKKAASGPSRNPFVFVFTYLRQVVAELRKVIWPNRKQMVSYTTVVLVFLTFMVALIGGVDLGLAKLVTLVFG